MEFSKLGFQSIFKRGQKLNFSKELKFNKLKVKKKVFLIKKNQGKENSIWSDPQMVGYIDTMNNLKK